MCRRYSCCLGGRPLPLLPLALHLPPGKASPAEAAPLEIATSIIPLAHVWGRQWRIAEEEDVTYYHATPHSALRRVQGCWGQCELVPGRSSACPRLRGPLHVFFIENCGCPVRQGDGAKYKSQSAAVGGQNKAAGTNPTRTDRHSPVIHRPDNTATCSQAMALMIQLPHTSKNASQIPSVLRMQT